MMLDSTCAPKQIESPQNISLLNKARQPLKAIIDISCYEYNEKNPQTNRRKARKNYLALSKRKRRFGKAIQKTVRKQLKYDRCDLHHIDECLEEWNQLGSRHIQFLQVIQKLYEQ